MGGRLGLVPGWVEPHHVVEAAVTNRAPRGVVPTSTAVLLSLFPNDRHHRVGFLLAGKGRSGKRLGQGPVKVVDFLNMTCDWLFAFQRRVRHSLNSKNSNYLIFLLEGAFLSNLLNYWLIEFNAHEGIDDCAWEIGSCESVIAFFKFYAYDWRFLSRASFLY